MDKLAKPAEPKTQCAMCDEVKGAKLCCLFGSPESGLLRGGLDLHGPTPQGGGTNIYKVDKSQLNYTKTVKSPKKPLS